MLNEFSLIQRYFQHVASASASADARVVLGIGDDCALLRIPADRLLAVSMDTLVADVHFPLDSPAGLIAHRALASNLSDLAAMGAEPHSFTLALTLPKADEAWLEDFSRGLFALADEANIPLVGGDTTRGPLSITVQVQGTLAMDDKGQARTLKRSQAKAGDLICVSGQLGEAAAGLAYARREASTLTPEELTLWQRYHQPSPRLALGQALVEVGATCALDISDGLLADLNHILQQSACGAVLDLDALPLSPALLSICGKQAAQRHALRGGDDYELCFCLSAERFEQLQRLDLDVGLSCIGVVKAESGLYDKQGHSLAPQGYKHF